MKVIGYIGVFVLGGVLSVAVITLVFKAFNTLNGEMNSGTGLRDGER